MHFGIRCDKYEGLDPDSITCIKHFIGDIAVRSCLKGALRKALCIDRALDACLPYLPVQ